MAEVKEDHSEDIEESFEDEPVEAEDTTGETDEPPADEPSEDETVVEDTQTEPPSEPKLVPIAALHDERRKAQQAKEEADRLKALLPATEEAPDPYEDIDKYNEWMKSQWEKEQTQKQEEVRRKQWEDSRVEMLSTDDYLIMEKSFELAAVEDESLVAKAFNSENPARFVYEQGKKYRESILGATQTTKEPSKEVERNTQAISGVNLATATAQDTNTPKVEKEETLSEMFEDQDW